jgi:hypothetical protein
MTAFCSHHDRLHELAGASRSLLAPSSRRTYAKRLSALVRDAIDRVSAAAGSRADWSLEPTSYRSRDPERDAAKFPQRPMILGDKWDF